MRPDRLVLVAGTATDVGKTWAAAQTARRLRAHGHVVLARKPVQSYEPGATSTDADVLAAATEDTPAAVCLPHRWLAAAMAPPMAAEVLGGPPFTVGDLAGELAWPPGCGIGLVEAVGGVRSPLAVDGDTVDLAAAVVPDLVLLVADAALGAIHAVRSSLHPLDQWPTLVLLNRFAPGDDLHERNRAWLADRDGIDVVTDIAALADRIETRATRETTT